MSTDVDICMCVCMCRVCTRFVIVYQYTIVYIMYYDIGKYSQIFFFEY